jgi:hypothetical protein
MFQAFFPRSSRVPLFLPQFLAILPRFLLVLLQLVFLSSSIPASISCYSSSIPTCSSPTCLPELLYSCLNFLLSFLDSYLFFFNLSSRAPLFLPQFLAILPPFLLVLLQLVFLSSSIPASISCYSSSIPTCSSPTCHELLTILYQSLSICREKISPPNPTLSLF